MAPAVHDLTDSLWDALANKFNDIVLTVFRRSQRLARLSSKMRKRLPGILGLMLFAMFLFGYGDTGPTAGSVDAADP